MEKPYFQAGDHIPNSVEGQTEISVDPILHESSVKIRFPVEFQPISNNFCLFPSTVNY
jgi:hypothetical protein